MASGKRQNSNGLQFADSSNPKPFELLLASLVAF
jgi:hypothetical protein